MSVIKRDELVRRIADADASLYEAGDPVSHQDTAEAAMRVLDPHIASLTDRIAELEAALLDIMRASPGIHRQEWAIANRAMGGEDRSTDPGGQ